MKLIHIFITAFFLAACILDADEKKLKPQSEPCPDCIQITVAGYFVVEGIYYFKVGYTVRQLIFEYLAAEGIWVRSPRVNILRASESTDRKIFVVHLRELLKDPSADGFTLRDGDLIYFTSPFL